jgi:hypothetical protein
VPVILVLTKFDALVSKVSLDIPSGDPQHHGRARASAHAMYEDSCRQIFRKEPRGVPAEIVSGMYSSFPTLEQPTDILIILSETKIYRSHRQSRRDDR